ncbi:hypothetical protein [Pseudomonas sp. PB3P13]
MLFKAMFKRINPQPLISKAVRAQERLTTVLGFVCHVSSTEVVLEREAKNIADEHERVITLVAMVPDVV